MSPSYTYIFSIPPTTAVKLCIVFCLQGWPVTEEQLKDVAEVSEVLQADKDFIDSEYRSKCAEYIPYPDKVEPKDCADAFVYLKEKFFKS